jgi:hypothetical protein
VTTGGHCPPALYILFVVKKLSSKMEALSPVTSPLHQGSVMRSKNTFLDYYKTVLEKVSFDYQLFNKEYRKAVNTLSPEEVAVLNRWIKSREFNAWS